MSKLLEVALSQAGITEASGKEDIGGNQNNQVKISRYYKNRVLGYRRITT